MDPAMPATPAAPETPPPAPPTPVVPTPPETVAAAPRKSKWIIIAAVAGLLVLFAGTVVVVILTQPKPVPAPVSTTPLIPTATTPAAPVAPAPQPVNQIPLSVTAPLSNTTVRVANLRVSGTTAPSADVSVNETDTKADATGKFSATITLSEGDNPIIITAMDENGNASEQEITVIYEPTQ